MTPHPQSAVREPPGVPEARRRQAASRYRAELQAQLLGNTTKLPSGRSPSTGGDAARRVPRRDARYRLRDLLSRITTIDRCASCGGFQISKDRAPSVLVQGGAGERVAHFSGVQLCGNVNVCPVCGPRIRQARADELDEAALAWLRLYGPGTLGFLTLTMPHDYGERLDDLLDTIRDSFSALVSGRRWQADKKDFGIQHYVVSHDSTVGKNGWHPHLHVLLFATMPISDAVVAALKERLYTRWARAVSRRGHREPSRAHGIQLERARSRQDVARYIAQVVAGDEDDDARTRPVALEMARGDLKLTRAPGHRTPFQLLSDLAERRARSGDWTPEDDAADDRDLALWHEYERAMKGVPSIRWSKGLRAAVGMAEEKTDEEIVAEEIGGVSVYEFLAADEWAAVRSTTGGRSRVLAAAEAHGIIGVKYVVGVLLAEWRARRARNNRVSSGDGSSPPMKNISPSTGRQSFPFARSIARD